MVYLSIFGGSAIIGIFMAFFMPWQIELILLILGVISALICINNAGNGREHRALYAMMFAFFIVSGLVGSALGFFVDFDIQIVYIGRPEG